jgi:putative two-component system response regulator
MGSAQNDRLEAFLQSSRSANEPELKTLLVRLSQEIKDRLDKGSPSSGDFFLSALRALSRLKGTSHADVRMTCLFDSVAYLFSNRFDLEAVAAARQLEHLAQRAGSKLWLRKAKMLCGIAYAHMGNVAEAFLYYASALTIAREINDVDGETSTLVNLGNALNYGGLYREAIPCLMEAVSLTRAYEEAKPFEAAALCNLAQSYLYLEDFPRGLKAISSSLELSTEPETAFSCFSRVIREFTYVQIALEMGKLSSAREHSGKCTQYALRSGTRRSENVALVARGLCEIHGGDVEKGLALLERSVSISGEETNPQYTAALAALVKGYEHAGQPERALSRMNELMAQIRTAREKGIIALISLPANGGASILFATEQNDLQAFHLREAQLRAQVAEREVVNSRLEMLERLAVTSDLKEEDSGEHGYRVGRLSGLLAEALVWNNDAKRAIELAARLHDLGKIAVPDRILLNSTELKEAERHFMSSHTVIGAELLAKSNIPQLRMAEEIARFHHEWWNGEGYPSKLAGKRIPIHARIVALADVFDALTHGRPFAKPWPMDRAIEEIKARRGTQFDPELTDVFLALVERLRIEHADLDEYLGRAGRSSPFLQARNKIRLMLAEERENEKKATVEGNETRH